MHKSENGEIFVGKNILKTNPSDVSGKYVERDGELYYRITNYDGMPPFFMTIVSNSDHWMFISSNGGLTAGRKNAENAAFPYYTDDKIHDSADITGSKTIIHAHIDKHTFLWEPFSVRYAGIYHIQRNLYKNIPGNKLIFEEINTDLELTFSYAWMNSDRFGFVKKSTLKNNSQSSVTVTILDGIQNLLPCGVDKNMQTEFSTLLDAYKKNELVKECKLGLFRLSSIPVDRAEPSEALKVTTVWSAGFDKAVILLSSRQVENFRIGLPVQQEENIRARRGAYFLHSLLNLAKSDHKIWYTVAEINQDAVNVADLRKMLSNDDHMIEVLEQDIEEGTKNLQTIVARSDGLQHSGDPLSANRHFSNVLFNVMRGGIFDTGYMVRCADFRSFLNQANRKLANSVSEFLDQLPDTIHYAQLTGKCQSENNTDLTRLCFEYLPLTFSRRHGDPSRPWNKFSIETKDEHGEKNLYYQGNWRDIFQNWEALAVSFPEFIESFMCKFVNASTADGYNPYRVTRDGFDWEVLDPDDPWSNIGYWGDHQIIYLLKFLELSQKYHPGKLVEFLTQENFVYANIPYRIKSYHEIVIDPQNTIDYDEHLAANLMKKSAEIGSDGKLVYNADNKIYYVNLTEKLLVSLLAKLTNFIPGAGIWMNTQRPEWNDANNALVGSGVSMVTLYYMRRFVNFCLDLYRISNINHVSVSTEVQQLFTGVFESLASNKFLIRSDISDADRKVLLDQLGTTGSEYREKIYHSGFSGKKILIEHKVLADFFKLVLDFIDHTICANRRKDGLYHAYNLIKFTPDNQIKIRTLYEMLEGQVAVLSSGYLSLQESVALLDKLRASPLFRKDQRSYILYPDRDLPRFVEKNNIPDTAFKKSELLRRLTNDDHQKIIIRDIDGIWHFNGAFRNSAILKKELQSLPSETVHDLLNKELSLVLEIYEELFDHQSFTGRSGTFFGYEGLGCIYWHMVSKLLLAVAELVHTAHQKDDHDSREKLKVHFYDILEGIGVHKSPDEFGAFPTDPYSHTPAHRGAQQPGMTGQVKEDILCRFLQLGLIVTDGQIHFSPVLLNREEFSYEAGQFKYYENEGQLAKLDLEQNTLTYTYCQIPIEYRISDKNELVLYKKDHTQSRLIGLYLNYETSAKIFSRTSNINHIEVHFKIDSDR